VQANPGGVAQLVEHLLCKQGVVGSSPFASTMRGFDLDATRHAGPTSPARTRAARAEVTQV
jgi:hypothetical protein